MTETAQEHSSLPVVFATNTVHARDRLDFWREEAIKAYVTHQFNTPVGRSFHGIIRAGTLGNLDVSIFECDQCRVQRTQRCLKSGDDDDILICKQVAGSTVLHQDGRDAVSSVNDLFLMDPRRPFSLGVGSGARSLIVKVPRTELQARLGDVTALTATPIAAHKPVAALAADFLSMVVARANEFVGSGGFKIAQQALDLVALAFEAERLNGHATLSSSRTTTVLRLKAAIEARLYDPALKPAMAAAAAGISVRYANALLAQEDMSLERYIMYRRLQHCRQALMDQAQSFRTVSDIAYSCGFSDVSHFARRFKAQFGCSPSEYRPRTKQLIR